MVSYAAELEQQMITTVEALLLQWIPERVYFPCEVPQLEPNPAISKTATTGVMPA
jgi:hypothetical protein